MRVAETVRRLAPLLLFSLWLGLPGGAWAEVRRLEVVGAIPLDRQTRRSEAPKDRAIAEALWEGVARVASELLADGPLPEPELEPGTGDPGGGEDDEANPVRTALGNDVTPYTRGFRILEDQGERPALFSDDAEAATEYVVVVEVQVEVDRVEERLVAAGLLERSGQDAELTRIRLEIRGLTQYRGYREMVAQLLGDGVGATSVRPLEFERGRMLLRVDADCGASVLLDRLIASASPQLRITPLSVDDAPAGGGGSDGTGEPLDSLVLGVSWSPPAPERAVPEEDLYPLGAARVPAGPARFRPLRRVPSVSAAPDRPH